MLNLNFIKFELVNYEDSLKFGKNQENRAFNHGHLQKLKAQMLNSFSIIPPITVNTVTNHLIDGQHRLKAYQILVNDGQLPQDSKIKVMYVEIPVEYEKQAIVDANTNSKNWSLDDYIASYVKAGIVSYKKLEEWCDSHSLCCNFAKQKESGDIGKKYSYRYAAAILKGKNCANDLKSAVFTITDDDLTIGNEVHAEMVEICDLLKLKGNGSWLESLAISWHEIRKQHDFKTWMKEFKSKKARYLKMPTDSKKEWDAIFAQAHMAIDKKAN